MCCILSVGPLLVPRTLKHKCKVQSDSGPWIEPWTQTAARQDARVGTHKCGQQLQDSFPEKARTGTASLTTLGIQNRGQPVMDCPGCTAMPCDGADASTSTCFLAPLFFAKRGLGGMMTGAMGPGLAILEGRPRRGEAGECLCQPG